jgi:uncharacterized coiled-coil protein SlyX
MYELIAQGLTLVLVIYFGLHLRQKIQTLQTTVAFQKDTIDALVKHQGDVDALNRTMKQTVDALQALVAFVNPEAQLKREQAFQTGLKRDMSQRLQEMATEVVQMKHLFVEAIGEAGRRLAETKSALAVITRARREGLEELERQLSMKTESLQDP